MLPQPAADVPATETPVPAPPCRDLFNGRDLTGWFNVNTAPDTWSVRDGLLVCSGQPIGVMRSDRPYENFILHVEWRHMRPGGNSGVFVWSEGTVSDPSRLPKGMEVQMLDLDWINQHPLKSGVPNHIGYVSGELFGAGGLSAIRRPPSLWVTMGQRSLGSTQLHRLGGGKSRVAGEDTPSCSASVRRSPSLPFTAASLSLHRSRLRSRLRLGRHSDSRRPDCRPHRRLRGRGRHGGRGGSARDGERSIVPLGTGPRGPVPPYQGRRGG